MVLPLSAAMVLGLFGARLGRGLPPSIAVPLLSLSALVTALASGFVLAVAGFIVLAQLPLVAAVGVGRRPRCVPASLSPSALACSPAWQCRS